MASLTQWTWVWVDSGTQWWTGRPGVLRFMGLQRVRHDWVTELSWTELKTFKFTVYRFHLSDDVLKHILNFPFPSPFTNITVFFSFQSKFFLNFINAFLQEKNTIHTSVYWIGQNIHSGFSITSYRRCYVPYICQASCHSKNDGKMSFSGLIMFQAQ